MSSTSRRTAIVTGAARGIGAAIARRLAADGFSVAVLDLDEAGCGPVVDAIESGGGRALAVGVDVTDAVGVEAAVARVAAELGAPTVGYRFPARCRHRRVDIPVLTGPARAGPRPDVQRRLLPDYTTHPARGGRRNP